MMPEEAVYLRSSVSLILSRRTEQESLQTTLLPSHRPLNSCPTNPSISNPPSFFKRVALLPLDHTHTPTSPPTRNLSSPPLLFPQELQIRYQPSLYSSPQHLTATPLTHHVRQYKLHPETHTPLHATVSIFNSTHLNNAQHQQSVPSDKPFLAPYLC